MTLPSFGERLQKDLPHAKMIVYPQCGHFPMLEQATASTADLDAFLAPTSVELVAPSKAKADKEEP